jgi:hypothetical protein
LQLAAAAARHRCRCRCRTLAAARRPRRLTSAGTLPDCAPLLRCLRWSRSQEGAATRCRRPPAEARCRCCCRSRSAAAGSIACRCDGSWVRSPLSQPTRSSALPSPGAHLSLAAACTLIASQAASTSVACSNSGGPPESVLCSQLAWRASLFALHSHVRGASVRLCRRSLLWTWALHSQLKLAATYASRRRHRYCCRCRWTLIKPPQPGPPLATRTSGKHASTPHAVASEAEAAPLSIVGYGVAPQLHLAAAAVRSSSSLLLSPLTVDSDQATATGTASGHTHKQKARSTKHSGVAARTRLRRERGGNSFQLAQLQTTTPNMQGDASSRGVEAAGWRGSMDRSRSWRATQAASSNADGEHQFRAGRRRRAQQRCRFPAHTQQQRRGALLHRTRWRRAGAPQRSFGARGARLAQSAQEARWTHVAASVTRPAADERGGAPGRGVVRGWARSSAQRCAASRSIPRM